jgi:hypothetical protein
MPARRSEPVGEGADPTVGRGSSRATGSSRPFVWAPRSAGRWRWRFRRLLPVRRDTRLGHYARTCPLRAESVGFGLVWGRGRSPSQAVVEPVAAGRAQPGGGDAQLGRRRRWSGWVSGWTAWLAVRVAPTRAVSAMRARGRRFAVAPPPDPGRLSAPTRCTKPDRTPTRCSTPTTGPATEEPRIWAGGSGDAGGAVGSFPRRTGSGGADLF